MPNNIHIPKDTVLSWKFPTKDDGVPSEVVTGRMVTRKIRDTLVRMHFKGTSLPRMRENNVWSVTTPVGRKRSRLPELVLRPVRAAVTHNAFVQTGDGTLQVVKK